MFPIWRSPERRPRRRRSPPGTWTLLPGPLPHPRRRPCFNLPGPCQKERPLSQCTLTAAGWGLLPTSKERPFYLSVFPDAASKKRGFHFLSLRPVQYIGHGCVHATINHCYLRSSFVLVLASWGWSLTGWNNSVTEDIYRLKLQNGRTQIFHLCVSFTIATNKL